MTTYDGKTLVPSGATDDSRPIEPVVLEGRPDLSAFLHDANGDVRRGVAVLFCPPFGWQEQASYRSIRSWASALAGLGYPAARFSLPATGDSGGRLDDGDLLSAWTESVDRSARWLRERCEVQHLVAIGIGLGGQIAWRAAALGAPIEDLVLWGVPETGRGLLREMRIQSRVVAESVGDDPDADPDNIIGFQLPTDLVASLMDIRLRELSLDTQDDRRRVLLIGRGELGVDRRLRSSLEDQGIEIDEIDGRDFDDLVANPQQSRPPLHTIDRVNGWLNQRSSVPPGLAKPRHPPVSETPVLHIDGERVVERALAPAGTRGRMFGVLSQPAAGACRTAVVFVGGGALPHTGPSRSWVEIGRRWSSRGLPALRLDLYGIGESEGDDPELLTDESFSAAWRARDVQAAMDELVERDVADRFILGGLCSGANVALQTALVDDRVEGLVLLNLVAFRYSPALAAERGRRLQIEQGLPGARRRRLDRHLVAAAFNYARPDRAWRLMRRSEERAEIVRGRALLDRLEARSVRTQIVLGAGEPMAERILREDVIGSLSRWPGLELETLPTRDHMLRGSEVQGAMNALVDRFLERWSSHTLEVPR